MFSTHMYIVHARRVSFNILTCCILCCFEHSDGVLITVKMMSDTMDSRPTQSLLKTINPIQAIRICFKMEQC